MTKIKILIADDHQLVLDGLKANISDVAEFEIVGEAKDGKEVMLKINSRKVDVILMDIDMPVLNGIEATRQITESNPDIKIIALTMHNEKGMINKMLSVGASGYLLKNTSKEELCLAIKKVAAGQQHFSAEVTTTLLEKRSSRIVANEGKTGKVELTEREEEVLKQIALGLSNKEVGEKLSISHRTVDTHRTNLMEKLHVKNIAGLIRYAMLNGYLD